MKPCAVATLTQTQARCLHLAALGLLTPPSSAATRAGLLAHISRMQLLQIDTISVVARSPFLVLYARLGNYPPEWLTEALASGDVFETWAHEACFAPASALPAHRAFNAQHRAHWGLAMAQRIARDERPALDALLAHIQDHGAVKSAHFTRPSSQATGGWWGWKPDKRRLEALFATGELMVARREGFARVYDLSERVAPRVQGAQPLKGDDVAAQFLLQSVTALGVTQARWIADYFRTKPRWRDADLDHLVATGELLRVQVANWQAPAYVARAHTELLEAALANQLVPTHTAFLSPFDPVVWDRERASIMFDFDYRLECYTPAHKRTFGYFCLPILHGGELIGRMDAKAHRARGEFEVISWHWQPGKAPTAASKKKLQASLAALAAWHGTPKVVQ